MELDINPSWVSGTYYHPRTDGGQPQGYSLFPAEQVPSDHYFRPSSRDFYTWTIR
jgi:hypothetical protein